MPYRIFIGAALRDADLASKTAVALRRRGFQTVSSWHDLADRSADADVTDIAARRAICERNQSDLRQADVFVLLFSDACRGSLMELADACREGIKTFVVGSPLAITTMAMRHKVRFVDSIEQVITALAAV